MSYFEYGIKMSFICFLSLEAAVFHNYDVQTEWEKADVPSFDELIVTWNGERPTEGKFLIYVSLKVEDWSPYLLYASWGPDHQSSFSAVESNVRAYQDVVEPKNGLKANGFRVKIETEDGALIDSIHSLHVYINDLVSKNQEIAYESVSIPVPGLSQRVLPHPRAGDLCSPTSTAAVVGYLTKQTVDPVNFALKSLDSGFDIFGNWVLNVAQGSSLLGKFWNCWVERLSGFDDLYARLIQGTPVIVSVRGPLVGSALPYSKGHLLVVKGFDAIENRVLCMDPAFPTDQETITSYPLTDFVEAWNRRGFISYIFEHK